MYVKFTREDRTDVYSGTIEYEVGKTAKAPDWNPKSVCGGGLHFGEPGVALMNLTRTPDKVFEVRPSWLSRKVEISEGKFKTKRLRVLEELDIKEILSKLAKDEKDFVRGSVAENPNTPPKVLSELAKDKSEFVRGRIALNRHAPPQSLSKLAEDSDLVEDSGYNILCRVAKNPNTPPETLSKLAEKKSVFIQQLVAMNPNASRETLSRLSKSIDVGM